MKTSVNPGRAGVFVDGKYLGPQHQVKLVDPRFEEFSTTGLRTPISEKYAAVYVNEHFCGHAGEFNNSSQRMMLPVGDYSVRIERTTGGPINQKVKIEENKTVIVQ